MIQLPEPLRQSNRFLFGLLIVYWLGSTTMVSVLVACAQLLALGRDVMADASRMQNLVTASLQSSMTTTSRQALLMSNFSSGSQAELDTMNMFLVVNASGRVVYASRSAWLGLSIIDPVLSGVEADDSEFIDIVDCFRNQSADCMLLNTSRLQPSLSSLTIARPISLPSADLGFRPERLLLIANYDPRGIIASRSEEFGVIAVVILVSSGLLTLYLAFLLRRQFLPLLIEAANVDGLTKLSNRSLFMEQAKIMLAEAQRNEGQFVFAIVDIDHFKRINDTFGHGAGDAALAHAGSVLRKVTRLDDFVCRLGGEEFALLLKGCRESAGRALYRLPQELEDNCLRHEGHQIQLKASIGAASTETFGYNIEYLYAMADKALYAAKHSGRNRIEWNDGVTLTRLAR